MARIGRNRVYTGRHVRVDFQLNRRGIQEIANGPEIRRALEDVVVHIAKPIAMAMAAEFVQSGEYERSFRVENTSVVAGPKRWPMLRASCRLVNISDHAVLVEKGRKGQHAHHILSKTVNHLVAIGFGERGV